MRSGTGSGQLDSGPDRDFPFAIASIPASAEQRRTAIAVILAFLALAAAVAPFADTQLPRVDAFVPVLQTVLSIADLITAVLLFTQYLILPRPAILAVASAYLCSAAFAFLQTLTFPAGYAPAGLFGDGFNTPAWFFVLWHATFPLGILVYALSIDVRGPAIEPGRSARATIALTIFCVGIVIAALTWLVTAEVGRLPVFYDNSFLRQTSLGNQVNVGLLLWYCIALATLLLLQRRTILDLWLIVVLAAWMPNFLVAALASSVRFSLGWYAARGFALVASFMLLIVLLTEMTVLYSRLANAFSLLRRERANRLMSVDAATAAIAHEVRSPLGAIALNASAGLAQIHSDPPALKGMDDILNDIKADSLRADEIISTVRALFKSPTDNRTPAELGGIAQRALALSEPDLLANSVAVTTDFVDNQVQVRADQLQLQQAIINLIRNAIEAMHSPDPGSRRLRLATRVSGSSVLLSIADTGTGISPEDHDRIFETFVTTKTSGMGLGLAISRTIIERHGGTLRVAESGPGGSVFELALPRG